MKNKIKIVKEHIKELQNPKHPEYKERFKNSMLSNAKFEYKNLYIIFDFEKSIIKCVSLSPNLIIHNSMILDYFSFVDFEGLKKESILDDFIDNTIKDLSNTLKWIYFDKQGNKEHLFK